MLRACLRAASISLHRTAERGALFYAPWRALSSVPSSDDAAEVADGDSDAGGAEAGAGFKRRDIAATVNSMRLDAIVRAGFGISRNRAEIDILSGMCTLNGQLMRVKDKQVKPGDTIVIQSGDRKAELKIVSADATKKDRVRVSIVRQPIPMPRAAVAAK